MGINLSSRRENCRKIVNKYASLAAVNGGVNMVPGLDVGLDFKICTKMVDEILEEMGVNEVKSDLDIKYAAMGSIGNNILKWTTRVGIQGILKNLAGKAAAKQVSKFIPFIGNVINAGIGYSMTRALGEQCIDECCEFMRECEDRGII